MGSDTGERRLHGSLGDRGCDQADRASPGIHVNAPEGRVTAEIDHAVQVAKGDSRLLKPIPDRGNTEGAQALIDPFIERLAIGDPRGIAGEPRILRQRERLERVRGYAEQLMTQYRDTSMTGEVSQYVEMVYGREAFVQRFQQLQQRARREVAVLNRPPYVTQFSEQTGTERLLLAGGVVVRSIYERADLEKAGGYDRATLLMDEGEQARVLPSVPLKLAIADRSLALVPLDIVDPVSHPSALIYPSSLLDALCLLFDQLWAQAAPIGVGTLDGEGADTFTERDRAVVQLLQSGMTDQAIARQLGVTERTVTRRVRRLMDLTGTETRFQLGWRAAQAGWLSET
jgi:DNA-binding CsgD family transcriptional regulator